MHDITVTIFLATHKARRNDTTGVRSTKFLLEDPLRGQGVCRGRPAFVRKEPEPKVDLPQQQGL
jgi:hypothetical protein